MTTITTPIVKILLCFTGFLFPFHFMAQNATEVDVNGSSTTNTITNNSTSIVDNALTITANGLINGFTVTITESYTSGDVLSYSGTLPSGISASSFNTTTRSIVFSGATSAANWQTLLRTVTLQTTSVVCNPESRKVAFIAGDVYFNPLNEHFYKIYSTNGSWTSGKAYASTQSYFGRIGYLATPTSQAENSFVYALMNTDSWIGCSDNYLQINEAVGYTLFADQNASEGKWYWITGPERGTKINNTNDCGSGVSASSGIFNRWSGAEPNDYPSCASTSGQEDYGHIWGSSGYWNDYPNSSSIKSIMEFGGMPNDITTSQSIFTRNLYINGAPSGTISNGGGTVCPSSNATTLSLTGFTGTVVKWQYSLDNFITAGVDISNTSINYTVSNISQTTYYRAIVNSTSGCSNLTTSAVPIFVSSTVAGNILADNNTICPNGSVNFNLFGNSGSVVKWQRSSTSNFSTGVTDISNTTTALSQTLSTAGTYYFRAVVQNGSCTIANTNGYTITVSSGTPPVGGTIANAEHCGPGSFSGTLSLSGSTGTVSKWQYSSDGGVVWTDVSNTTTSLGYSGVSANRLYRAVLTNGSCGTANSSSAQIYIYGTTVTKWLGGTSTDWADPTNWCGGVATNGMDMIVSSSAANNAVLDQNRTVGSITFSGANKVIRLGNNNLTASSVNNADADNRIKSNGTGSLKMSISDNGNAFFPIGNSTYNPITITNKSGAGDYFGVNVADQVYLNGTTGNSPSNPHVARTWNVSKTNANGGDGIDFLFEWNDSDEVGLIDVPFVNHHNGGNWHIADHDYKTHTSTSLLHQGYTGTFSPFSIASGESALPSEMVYLNATCNETKNTLTWATASESNTDIFIIEKSEDGIKWNTLDKVKAAGNSNVTIEYLFLDQNAKRGVNYYQIKQVDLNGNTNIYGPITANCQSEELEINVFPNPTKGDCQLNINANKSTEYLISVENNEGKVLYTSDLKVVKGNNIFPISTKNFASGIYTLKISNGDNVTIRKIVVLEK
jgi:hypothetical protein